MKYGQIESEDSYVDETRRLKEAMIALRRGRTLHELPTWEEPVSIREKKVYMKGRTTNALILTLTPTGCEWAGSNGGCTMCGEFSGSMGGNKIPSEYHISQFASGIVHHLPRTKASWIRIFNEGSFLNPREIDPLALKIIITLVSMIKGVERITIESRAEYITEENLQILKDCVKDSVELEIGIGLEAQNDVVRNVCIGKGMTKENFEATVKLIKDFGLRSLTYILVKPPFLTEGESLSEAVNSIKYAFSAGTDAVKLEPTSIHSCSLVEVLFSEGLYKVPWLWTVMDIIKQTNSMGEIRIGGQEYYPKAMSVAHNYHEIHNDRNGIECNARSWNAIRLYNQTLDPFVFDLLDCKCKTLWKEEIYDTKKTSLKNRINQALDRCHITERYSEIHL
jgi:archaeosine synthase beta-subunit